jgi:ABC-2 type transport system permease protein
LAGCISSRLQQVLLLGLALAFASEFENGSFKRIKKCLVTKIDERKIIPYLIMSFGLWIMYWLFTLWFRIPFYDNLFPRLWQEYS